LNRRLAVSWLNASSTTCTPSPDDVFGGGAICASEASTVWTRDAGGADVRSTKPTQDGL
jgi:hypothetical protein